MIRSNFLFPVVFHVDIDNIVVKYLSRFQTYFKLRNFYKVYKKHFTFLFICAFQILDSEGSSIVLPQSLYIEP